MTGLPRSTFIDEYLRSLRGWAKGLSPWFENVVSYGSLPNGEFDNDRSDPSDFDLLLLFREECASDPLRRREALVALRSHHAEIMETQQRIRQAHGYQYKHKHSYLILTRLECRFGVVKDDDTMAFFELAQRRHSLIDDKDVDLSQLTTDSLPADRRVTGRILERIQKQRAEFVLSDAPEQFEQQETRFDERVKRVSRWAAIVMSNPKAMETSLDHGWHVLKEQTAKAAESQPDWTDTVARLEQRLIRTEYTLTVGDCVGLWELIAEEGYRRLRDIHGRPERCELVLAEFGNTLVEQWRQLEQNGDGQDSPLRYQCNSFSRPRDRTDPATFQQDHAANPNEHYEPLCDRHAPVAEKFTTLFQQDPRGSGRLPTDVAEAAPGNGLSSQPQTGCRILIVEDAGAGKSICLQRLEAWLADRNSDGGASLFAGHGTPFVLRFEAGNPDLPWPALKSEEQRLETWKRAVRAQYFTRLQPLCEKFQVTVEEVVDRAFEIPGRVVVLLDAFDQLAGPDWQAQQSLLKRPSAGSVEAVDGLHLVVTSRRPALESQLADRALLDPEQWIQVRLDGFTAWQQYWYLEDLMPESMRAAKAAPPSSGDTKTQNEWAAKQLRAAECFGGLYREVEELVQVPVLLRFVRLLANKQKTFPKFTNRADLYWQATAHLLQPANSKLREVASPDAVSVASEAAQNLIPWMREILAAAAYEMMLLNAGSFTLASAEQVKDLSNKVVARITTGGLCDPLKWPIYWRFTETLALVTKLLITERVSESYFGWKHKGMMEFFCGLYLAKNSTPGWRSTQSGTTSPTVKCLADSELAPHVGDPNWRWAWRFATELHQATDPECSAWQDKATLAASLSPLFGAANGRKRPCELMWRALVVAQWKTTGAWPEAQNWVDRLRRQFLQHLLPEPLGSSTVETQRIALSLVPQSQFEALVKRMKEFRQTKCDEWRVKVRQLPLAYRTSDEEQEFQNSTRHLQLWEEFDIGQWSKQIGRDRVNQNWCQCPPLVGSTREIASWLNERRDKNSTDSDWFWFRQGSVPNVGYGDEGPRHWWRVKRFWLQATAVTVEQYLLFDPQHRAIYADSFEKTAREPDCPVIGVSWYDAAMFAVWVGDQCRLPTESEWEFACRAGHDNEGDLYSLADGPLRDISPQHANYGNKVGETLPVRWDAGRRDTWRSSQGAERPPAFLPNQWGLWQMHGNVWEWCANLAEYDFSDDDLDRWVEAKQKLSAEYQKRLDRNNELGKLSQTPPASVQPEAEESQMFTVGPSRVLRGGSWDNGGGRLRCAYRLDNDPEPLIVNIGFRLCWES